MKKFTILLAFAYALPVVAHAHPYHAPLTELSPTGAFFSGALYPFLTPTFALALFAMSLWLGAKKHDGLMTPLLTTYALGLVFAVSAPVALPDYAVLLVALCFGSFLALDLSLPPLVAMATVCIAAFLFGSGSTWVHNFDFAFSTASGSFTSTLLFFFGIILLRARVTHENVTIATRILGAWIAAAALMVSALSLVA